MSLEVKIRKHCELAVPNITGVFILPWECGSRCSLTRTVRGGELKLQCTRNMAQVSWRVQLQEGGKLPKIEVDERIRDGRRKSAESRIVQQYKRRARRAAKGTNKDRKVSFIVSSQMSFVSSLPQPLWSSRSSCNRGGVAGLKDGRGTVIKRKNSVVSMSLVISM